MSLSERKTVRGLAVGAETKKEQKRLATQKQLYALWWAFLHIKLTEQGLGRHYDIQWDKYARWGEVRRYRSFERWWQEKGRYLQSAVVREVTEIPAERAKNIIYLEVPINQAPLRLAKRAKHIIEARFKDFYPGVKNSRRIKSRFVGETGFTEHREIRIQHFRRLLTLYHKVFKKHPQMTGIELLKVMNEYDQRNETYNQAHPDLSDRKKRFRFEHLTTWHLNEHQLEAQPMFVEENYKQWQRRNRLLREELRQEGLDADRNAHVRRERYPVPPHLNYRDNSYVKKALRNLIRAKDQLEAVLGAVAKGEFPGESLYRVPRRKRTMDDGLRHDDG
jgi:hypothetical protein